MAENLPETAHDFPRSIGKPAQHALLAAGYHQLKDLASASEKDLLKLHGLGPKALWILRETLAAQGRTFKS